MSPEFGSKPELSEITAKQIAILYAGVFGAPPWNEVWHCPQCNRFYGPDCSEGTASLCCSTPLVTAYPESETIDYIFAELSKPLAKLELTHEQSGQMQAFAWGYLLENVPVFAKKKWSQLEGAQARVIQAIAQFTKPEMPFYYISEVGVSPLSRGNGIGLKLTTNLLTYGLENRLSVIFRTNWASPMMRIARKLQMIQIMGPEINVFDNQIVQSGKVAGFIDEINPDRTLFIATS